MKTKIECVALACATDRYLAVAQELNGQIYIYSGEHWMSTAPSKHSTTRERFRLACGRKGCKTIRGRIFIEVEQ